MLEWIYLILILECYCFIIFKFIFSFKTFLGVFSSKRKLHNSIMNYFFLTHKITIHVMKKLQNYLELFLQG
jgi:hypothetical protein